VTDDGSELVDVLAAHAARKAARDAPLLEKLLGTDTSDANVNPVRERVQRAAAELEAALAALEGETELQPEPPSFLDQVATAQAEQKRALVRTLTSRERPRDAHGRFA
jgi:hypothetical protein